MGMLRIRHMDIEGSRSHSEAYSIPELIPGGVRVDHWAQFVAEGKTVDGSIQGRLPCRILCLGRRTGCYNICCRVQHGAGMGGGRWSADLLIHTSSTDEVALSRLPIPSRG